MLSKPIGALAAAMAGCLGTRTLAALRQLALRWQAAALTQPPQRHRSGGQVHDVGKDRERVVVALPGHS